MSLKLETIGHDETKKEGMVPGGQKVGRFGAVPEWLSLKRRYAEVLKELDGCHNRQQLFVGSTIMPLTRIEHLWRHTR